MPGLFALFVGKRARGSAPQASEHRVELAVELHEEQHEDTLLLKDEPAHVGDPADGRK